MVEYTRDILVTGAGGFLGYHMANHLADLGHRVEGLDLHFPDQSASQERPRFTPLQGDFRDREFAARALQGKSVVYHFASAHLQISLDESEYWDINVHSLKPFLQSAQQAGCKRFIHVSSVGAYGRLAEIPANEDTPCQPQSIYGETKLAGEAEVRNWCGQNGLPYVILRPAWIYGQGCPRTAKLTRMLAKKRFIMIGRGLNKRHPMYIRDMLTAFELAMEKEQAQGELMIIGGDQIITTRELVDTFSAVLNLPGPLVTLPYPLGLLIAITAEQVFALVNKEPPLSRRTLEFFDTDNGFDISKSKRILEFTPAYTFRQGVEDYARTINR